MHSASFFARWTLSRPICQMSQTLSFPLGPEKIFYYVDFNSYINFDLIVGSVLFRDHGPPSVKGHYSITLRFFACASYETIMLN